MLVRDTTLAPKRSECIQFVSSLLNLVVLHSKAVILHCRIRLGFYSGQFHDVPAFLTIVIRDSFYPYANDREILYVRAAIAVIAYYVDRHFLVDRQDAYLQSEIIRDTNVVNHKTPLRRLLIGRNLFDLRRMNGFSEFCRRLSHRDVRSTLYEILAARLCASGGYTIIARPETYVKGQDYDFSAIRDGEQINIEVTTLAEKEFFPKTITNSLNHKRKQVPPTSPAIIFISLPMQWMSIKMEWDFYLMQTCFGFFCQSKRINAVVFFGERYFESDSPGKGGFLITKRTYTNQNARIKMKNMDFLFRRECVAPIIEQLGAGKIGTITSDQMERVADHLMTGDFYRWVDYLVPKMEL
jgi:hypothetical protein